MFLERSHRRKNRAVKEEPGYCQAINSPSAVPHALNRNYPQIQRKRRTLIKLRKHRTML
jgi:hypothetical protein